MSCDYANGLSHYDNKGVLGLAEKFDSFEKVKEKCDILVKFIQEAKHIVVHTGAGISTSAGIPDFRGPNGVWTLEKKGLKPEIGVSFTEAKPTKTHMALKQLVDDGKVQYIISQNIDGLHLKSGIGRENLAELHGNMFVEQCTVCRRQFVRQSPAPTVGQKYIGKDCYAERTTGRKCRGKLNDVILDWEHSLPEDDLEMAEMHSSIANLSICLGTTLQIVPSGNLPLNTLKYGGKLVICNLQPTKHDNKADLVINTYVDDVFEHVMKGLNKIIPEYAEKDDPTKADTNNEWTILKSLLQQTRKKHKATCNGVVKKRVLVKNNQESSVSKINSKKVKNEVININNEPNDLNNDIKNESDCENNTEEKKLFSD